MKPEKLRIHLCSALLMIKVEIAQSLRVQNWIYTNSDLIWFTHFMILSSDSES